MNTNMTWVYGFNIQCVLVLWTRVASALEGFRCSEGLMSEVFMVWCP